jgi:hypothetical protein
VNACSPAARSCALLLSVLALGTLGSCADEPAPSTQLILVADTDIPRIDNVEFTIEANGVATQSAQASYADDGAPLYLTVLRDQGPLGPVTVRARGREGSTVLVTRTHVLSFVPDRALVVPLHLLRSCAIRACAASETCSEAGCIAQQLEPSQLADWAGQAPSLDTALAGDAGTATCGNDGTINLQTDPKHCGRCSNACKANEQCSAGQCAKK